MLKTFTHKIKKNFGIFSLVLLIIITALSTTFFNHKKDIKNQNFENFVDNIYLKKTLNYLINNLEPKYKKIFHKVKSGETFDKILDDYSISKEEIILIKKLSKTFSLSRRI